MHAGINRPDGRHWCAPNEAPEGEDLLFCNCGKVWSYDAPSSTWSELADERELPELDETVEIEPRASDTSSTEESKTKEEPEVYPGFLDAGEKD